ncbi:UDP-N-acetylmuramoyl-tripeptide--D-alanyl-D-alanine ligase [Natronincola peptidivorans]|uniref:UDP-N-acetylmuramoyl-tripeptide--D-alanyl-D-alanine ligase n=1 Tax=Natronincola peptidivorans TaxID=426128 RepID=A0A1H9Y876_9FIRM|nr:UDP-N-acetylmuramoyl-tripeptide--D-alanyl-D-alanine ligase [Natronincola peptidivorans]SES64583.1 UDP-N-acetylmuramoyl-tripeptide--D-alanyl-D-alanine ligase [Natronincola peptidivorans]
MIKQSFESIIRACNGKVIQRGVEKNIEDISTDTRKMKDNSLFVPLVGENFDGHEFLVSAKNKGACGILYTKGRRIPIESLNNIYIIEVEDTLEALQNISKYYRELFDIPFIAITGSTGKTSTKDMISSVLSNKYSVLKNIGNLNNEIGLPLTVFNLDKQHEIAVLEMGMSGAGEILDLAKIVKPTVAVITNIGVSHIESLGSRENIMKAKMEIATYLKKDDYLLLNGDNDLLSTIKKERSIYQKVFFGLSKKHDIYPKNLVDLGENGFTFDIEINNKDYAFAVKQPGIHNVYNALAAIWIGLHNDMEVQAIREGLLKHEASKMRMEIISNCDVKIINDAYNASPDSMKAALRVLGDIKGARKIAVLGDMFELGDFSQEGHRMVGTFAVDEVDILITVGNLAKWIADEAIKRGKKDQVYTITSNDEAIELLDKLVEKDDVVLVKGSRGMMMEEIVRYLQERS